MAEDRVEIDQLAACGADPNAKDAGGCTPLHYAADSNPVGEVARALFEVLAAVKNSAYLLVRNGRFGRLAQIGG